MTFTQSHQGFPSQFCCVTCYFATALKSTNSDYQSHFLSSTEATFAIGPTPDNIFILLYNLRNTEQRGSDCYFL